MSGHEQPKKAEPVRDVVEGAPGVIESAELAPLGEDKVAADRKSSYLALLSIARPGPRWQLAASCLRNEADKQHPPHCWTKLLAQLRLLRHKLPAWPSRRMTLSSGRSRNVKICCRAVAVIVPVNHVSMNFSGSTYCHGFWRSLCCIQRQEVYTARKIRSTSSQKGCSAAADFTPSPLPRGRISVGSFQRRPQRRLTCLLLL